jgi:glutathione S-transferase
MNLEAHLPEAGARAWQNHPALRDDVARVEAMWADALRTSGGPYLFGAFSAADAYFAPVCARVRCYALPVSADTRAYGERVLTTPGVARFIAEAQAEHDFLDFEEPYRQAPTAPSR